MTNKTATPSFAINLIAYVLAAVALVFVLGWHLLPALLAGLLIHELVYLLAPFAVRHVALKHRTAKFAVITVLAVVVIMFVTVVLVYLVHFFRSGDENLSGLFQKMADILESSRHSLPEWLAAKIPQGVTEVKEQVVSWMRSHATEITSFTKTAGRVLAHILIGMIVGAMVALYEFRGDGHIGPLGQALNVRAKHLAESFRQVVFAQVYIAALNTLFTSIFLLVILPLTGVKLPFLVTIILLTFLFGLLPVIGNLMSNTVIVVVSLSFSLGVAVFSLIFLIVIHKLEYFLNAKIIGSQIQTHAWEILLAMLTLEVLFGLPGVVAAPIFYAYLKKELRLAGLV